MFGEFGRETVEQPNDGVGRWGWLLARPQCVPQRSSRSGGQYDDAVLAPPEAVRDRHMWGKAPVNRVESLDFCRAHHFQEEAAPSAGGLDHGPTAGAVGAGAKLQSAAIYPEFVEQ
jgi:hypothetical protein